MNKIIKQLLEALNCDRLSEPWVIDHAKPTRVDNIILIVMKNGTRIYAELSLQPRV